MASFNRVTQNNASAAFASDGTTRVTEADLHAPLDVQAPVRITACSIQVAIGFENPRVTQVNAIAAIRLLNLVPTSADIEVL